MIKIELRAIRKILENKQCTIHNNKAVVTIHGGVFKLTTCCEAFEKVLEAIIDTEMSNQIQQHLDEIFIKLSRCSHFSGTQKGDGNMNEE